MVATVATLVAAASSLACESRREGAPGYDRGVDSAGVTRPGDVTVQDRGAMDRDRGAGAMDRGAMGQGAASAQKTTPTNVEQVKDSPAYFYGKEVRLSGEVDDVLSDRSFVLEGAGWAFNDNITVLTKTPVNIDGASLFNDEEVIVRGTVRPFVVAEVERDLGWDLGPDLEAQLREKPVVIADSIRRVGEVGRWTAAGTEQTDQQGPVVALMTIIAAVDPATLAGRTINLRNEKVLSLMGKGMWIGPSAMGRVFVVPEQMPEGVVPGDRVDVKGTLKAAPNDAASAWNLPADMAALASEGSLFVDSATVTKVETKGQAPGT